MLTKAAVLAVLETLKAAADPDDVARFDEALADVATLEEGDPRLIHYHPTWDPSDPDNQTKWRALWLPPLSLAALPPPVAPEEP